VEEQVIVIFAGVKGYLDTVDIKKVTAFEQALLGEIRTKKADMLERVRTEKKISGDTEAELRAFLDKFVKVFVA
jgi:F-type H+-transporting ATPase subunit alpha